VKVKDFSVDENAASAILESGETINAKLIVGADGRNSFTREWMDVPVRTRNYKQRAIVFTAAHENPHDNIAVEHFRPEGPFAILPMADSRRGNAPLLCRFHRARAGEKFLHASFSDADFNAELNRRFPENYGRVELIGRRAAHPLSLVHAASYIAPRMALIADAAHAIHPVAGQGLNLGFRDVKALADLVKEAKSGPRRRPIFWKTTSGHGGSII
jgi:2-octaprenyl-6-methoxyphenol hydroxylase